MAKLNNGSKSSKKIPTVAAVVVEGVTDTAPAAVSDLLTRKLTREEWRALSPEIKRARKALKRTSRPSLAPRLAKNVERLARRIRKIGQMVRGADAEIPEINLHTDLHLALTVLERAVEGLAALPSGWKPLETKTGTAAASTRLAVGDFVAIAEKRRESFAGLVEAEEMLQLRVVAINGKRVIVQTEGGTKMVLPINVVVRNAR